MYVITVVLFLSPMSIAFIRNSLPEFSNLPTIHIPRNDGQVPSQN
jgi:hypothetical protein